MQIKSLITAIKDHDIEIKSYYKDCDDHAIFDSLFGAGLVFAPRLLVAFGENRERYKTANEIQKYAGIALC